MEWPNSAPLLENIKKVLLYDFWHVTFFLEVNFTADYNNFPVVLTCKVAQLNLQKVVLLTFRCGVFMFVV